MAKELKEGKFVAFKNKKLNESHPDFKGDIMNYGEKGEIVVWIMTDKNGNQFLSGSINRKNIIDVKKDNVDGNKW